MGWIAITTTILRATMSAIHMVEGSRTQGKGSEKQDMALQFAQQMLDVCGTTSQLLANPEVQKALREYSDAYVKVQNLIAKASQ